MSATRYGIIGSGMMGQEHIRNIALLDGAEIVAVNDPHEGMRTAGALLAGETCASYETHRQLLNGADCDAYVIASPNHTHFEILSDLLSTGRPILAEKPLCTSLDDCRKVVARAEASRSPVWVAMEYRYMPPVARLLRELQGGTAGRLHMISIREHRYPFLKKIGDWNRFSAKSGGTLVEKCCHFFDLMRLIAGSEPVRLYASGAMSVNFLDEVHADGEVDILDNAFCLIDFDNGVRAMLDLCMFAEGSYWQETISATGDAARVDAFVPGPARFTPYGKERYAEIAVSSRTTGLERRETVHVDEEILAAGDHHGSTFFQHRKFLSFVRGEGEIEVSLDDGLRAVMIGAAAEESVRTGRPVCF